MKILLFAGSTRQQSFNRQLARAAADMATAAGAQATLLELGELDIPMYDADLEAHGTPPDVLRLKQLLWEHPAWVICSPEYNGSYTALLKNTIDWASSPVAGCARKAIWHRCCTRWAAGLRQAPMHSAARPARLTSTAR